MTQFNFNRVKVVGTGYDTVTDFDLGAPVHSFSSFVDGTFKYAVVAVTGEWQVGEGVVTGTSLTRGTVEENHLGTTAQIDFTGLAIQIAQVISADVINTMLGKIDDLEQGSGDFNADEKVEDKGDWVQSHYDMNDQVSEAGFLLRCINPAGSDDYPAPTAFGNSFYVYDQVYDLSDQPILPPVFIPNTSSEIKVKTGMLYSFSDANKITEIVVNVPKVSPTTHYRVGVIVNPFSSTPLSKEIYDPVIQENIWTKVLVTNFDVKSGDQVLVYLETTESAATTEVINNYTYLNPGGAAPLAGEIIRSSDASIIRISTTDNDAADNSIFLADITSNDSISITQLDDTSKWELLEFSGAGTLLGTAPNEYYEYTTSPKPSGGVIGNNQLVHTVLKIFNSATIEYNQTVDYFLNTDLEGIAQGYFQEGGNAAVINNTAYGVDLRVQNMVQSADWMIRATLGQTGSTTATKAFTHDFGSVASGVISPNVDEESNLFRVTLTGAGVTIMPPVAILSGTQHIEGSFNIIGGDTNAPVWGAGWDFGTEGEPTLSANSLVGYYQVNGDALVKAWTFNGGFS